MRTSALLLLVLGAVLPACGEEETPRPAPALESDPRGEPIEVGTDLQHGDAWRAEITTHVLAFKRGTEGGVRKDQELPLEATVEHTWQVHQPHPEAPMTSRITWRYTQAEGKVAERLLARPTIHGRLAHGPRGRPVPASLRLEGGTKHDQVETHDLIGSLLLAGYGGAPSWLPPRPVREGESWPLAPHVRPRALDRMRTQASQQGLDADAPTFRGTVRLERVVDRPEGRALELVIDATLEMEGRGLESRNRFQGRALIDAGTGVPHEFDVTHVHRTHVRSGSDDVVAGSTVSVRGTVTRIGG